MEHSVSGHVRLWQRTDGQVDVSPPGEPQHLLETFLQLAPREFASRAEFNQTRATTP
jgi:hypothetical protein